MWLYYKSCQSGCRTCQYVIDHLQLTREHITFVRVDWDLYGSDEVATSRRIPRRSTLLVLRGEEELGRIVAGTGSDEIQALMELGLPNS